MCKPSKPKTPPPPPPPEPPAEAPKRIDAGVQKARTDEKRQSRLASGRRGTILTSGALSTNDANTGAKTLLGQ